MKNNFNPFSEPYHPVQIIGFATIAISLIPAIVLLTPLTGIKFLTDYSKMLGDIPKSLKETWKSYVISRT